MKKINALYNDSTIRVYQAYNSRIADEAIKLGTFGKSFKRERMTWIKPSFLWMMYRSGWAEKENQERILAIDITRDGFEEILKNAILSTYNKNMSISYDEWKMKITSSEVRCQFDPDRDIYGNPQQVRAIQLGLRGKMINSYIDKWIVRITDITDEVKYLKKLKDEKNLTVDKLPIEKEYPVSSEIRRILFMEE
ncbi:MAG: DUF4291 domain-containing protein [Ruminococcus sp.]|nr:DUF4291 domain-containing protein [Ruminococcus sp.]